MKVFRHGLASVVLLVLLTAVPAQAVPYGTSDLAGSWRGQWMEGTTGNVRYWLSITVTLDSDGDVTSGTWNSSAGLSGTISGGSMDMDGLGSISGSMTYVGDQAGTITVHHGWIDESKDMVYMVTKKGGGQLAAGMLCKQENSGFSTADLEGDWSMFMQDCGLGAGDDTYWIKTDLTLNDQGLGSGSYDFQGVFTGSISSASLTLGATGGIAGTMTDDFPNTIVVGAGQVNPDLSCGTMAITKSYDRLGAGFFIWSTPTGFSTADLHGTWAVYHTYVVDENTMLWIAGYMTVDKAGNITGGEWEGPPPSDPEDPTPSGTYVGGTMAVADDGTISGDFILSNAPGKTIDIEGGQMGASKTFAGIVGKWGERVDPGHVLDTVFMVKRAGAAAGLNGPLLLLLQ
jgi:hypothetical protein